jgi:hypothetical protein
MHAILSHNVKFLFTCNITNSLNQLHARNYTNKHKKVLVNLNNLSSKPLKNKSSFLHVKKIRSTINNFTIDVNLLPLFFYYSLNKQPTS